VTAGDDVLIFVDCDITLFPEYAGGPAALAPGYLPQFNLSKWFKDTPTGPVRFEE
jgi:hypothetical protein